MKQSIITAVLLFTLSVSLYADYKIPIDRNNPVVQLAIADVERDIKDYEDGFGFFSGCLFGPIGLAVTMFYEPKLPVYRFIGRSAVYVHTYAEVYRQRTRDIEKGGAAIGCFLNIFPTAAVTSFLVYLITEK